ncbi:glutamine amidotransferase-related protein [Dyella silvatica]|uniref:glutamine amidotransferase-related protein n=1 Tax=Dyella silvatica TaxID=2992128 RepID=UPI002254A396|nr:glutamine amidotransferase [Dyella silvatica]
MKPVLIIRTGRAPDSIRARHGDFPHWFRISAQLALPKLRVVDVAAGESLPPPQEVAGAIITGSAAMVTERAAWSEHALGGRVDYLPGGREIGTVPIEVLAQAKQDALAARLPASFRAHTTHEQSVLEAPAGAVVLAQSVRDPHQLLRYGKHAVSTQFHPEFNADVMRAYIHRKRADMQREGFDPRHTFKQVAATPIARRLLSHFARYHGLAAAR